MLNNEDFMDYAKNEIANVDFELDRLINNLEDEDKIELEQCIISLLCKIESKINN